MVMSKEWREALVAEGFDEIPAYPGRVADRLSDLLAELDRAIAAQDWTQVVDFRARAERLRTALDAASFESLRDEYPLRNHPKRHSKGLH